MADNRSRLSLDILAKVGGTGEVDRLARSIDNTGDEMSEAARDALLLDKAIDEVTDELRELNRELLTTGNIEALDKSKNVRSTLSMLKRMRRELGDVEKEAGRAGRTIGDVLGALPSQLKGGAIIALGAAAASAAPLIAGAVSAAVIGSVGAGGIVGGMVAASRDSRVQAAAGDMVGQLDREFSSLGPLFSGPVINSIGILGDAATGLLRDLRPELAALGPVTEQLAAGVAGLIREAGPGLAAALRESVPILEALAAELPGLGADLAEVFGIIAGGGDDARDALIATINLVGILAKASAVAIRAFTEMFGLLKQSADIPILGATAQATAAFLGLNEETGRLKVATSDLAGEYAGGLIPELDTTASSLIDQREVAVRSADSLLEAAAAAGSLSEAMNILNGGVLSTRDAERAFQESIDAASAAVEENGRTLDINTAKGRDNQEKLDDIAKSAIQVADAVLEETGSQRQANEALEQGRKALIDAAEQMGLSRKEAKKLADELLGIPGEVATTFRAPGLAEVNARAENFLANMRLINSMGVNVGTGSNIPGLTPGHFAEGGSARAGTLAVVGERGPELVRFEQNARVFSNEESRRMVSGGSSAHPSGGITVNLTAFSDQFRLKQVLDDLAMRGAN